MVKIYTMKSILGGKKNIPIKQLPEHSFYHKSNLGGENVI